MSDYLVELTYFKMSGKYYSSGRYQTELTELWRVWDEVAGKQRSGALPGLTDDAHEFIVMVRVPGHPHDHPHLVVPGSMEVPGS